MSLVSQDNISKNNEKGLNESWVNTKRVLHVDDDPSYLELTKIIIEDMGNFRIDSVLGVDEAYKKIETVGYDAIISDYEMPNKDGLAFLSELRQNYKRIPFILFTGKGREEIAIKALNLGADAYINKVGDPSTVYGELKYALDRTILQAIVSKRLEESEKKYRNLVENALFGVAIFQGSPAKIVFANYTLGKILGLSSEDLLNLTPQNIIKKMHPDDREVNLKRFNNRLSGKEVEARFEFRVIHENGRQIWLEGYAEIINFKGSTATQIMYLDVTERKTIEKALMESEINFRIIFENVHDIITFVDTSGRIIDVNTRVEAVLGYTREEVIGQRFSDLDLVKAEDVPKLVKTFTEAVKQSEVKENIISELELRHKNGSSVYTEVGTRFVKDQSGKALGIANIFRDISERRKNKEELLRSNERFNQIVDNAHEWIWEVDEDGLYTYSSPAVKEILGYTPEELVGKKHFWDLFEPQTREERKQDAINTIRKKQSFREFTNYNIHKDGRGVWLSTSGSPFFDVNGKLLGYRGSDMNISAVINPVKAL